MADFHGALKGLPPNARANSLCDACGLEYKVRGDVFIGQLHVGALGLQLGDAPPQVAMDPAWMKAVADANRAGMGRKPGRKITDILSPHLRSAMLRAGEAGPAVADAAPNPLLEPSAQARAAAMTSAAAAARAPVAAGPVSSAQSAPTSAAGTNTTGGPAATTARILEACASLDNLRELEPQPSAAEWAAFVTYARASPGAACASVLGSCYYCGVGVREDAKEAARLFREAAEAGHSHAQCKLGWCYETGEGVSLDMEEAVCLYRRAADQGHARAQFNLGMW